MAIIWAWVWEGKREHQKKKNLTAMRQGGGKESIRVEEIKRSVFSHLVGLGNVRKHTVHLANQHSVLERVARVLDDGDNVGALLGLCV